MVAEAPQHEDRRALDIINLRDRERDKQETFRSLWQETADLMFPRQNAIEDVPFPGEDKSRKVYDATAIRDSQDMASGLSAALIPAGQKFFGLKLSELSRNPDDENDAVNRYLAYVTEATHEALFESNFMLQLNETLRSLVVFGTGNLYSEWDLSAGGLNFKDYDISCYQILEDNHGNVDTVLLTLMLTARQARQEFGDKPLSEEILKAAEDPRHANDTFEFIHFVGPRSDRNPALYDNLNMPWQSCFVDVKGKRIIDESGFEENPFAVVRWMKSSAEVYGRGQGTECLADVRMLQQMEKDFIDLCNKYANPPLEVIEEAFKGKVRLTPGAINYVREVGTIRGIEQQVLGNFPLVREAKELQQEKVHQAFFRDVFVTFASLEGDRRMTTVEVNARLRESLRRLAQPVARLQSELFNPVISRSVKLLMRNGRLPYPPPELEGARFGIEYEGDLALALKDQQARGFVQFAAVLRELAEVAPDCVDVLDLDDALPDIARTYGVKSQHIASREQIAAKRAARAQAAQAAQLAAGAEVAGKAYAAGTKAPESGSPSEAMMEMMGQ